MIGQIRTLAATAALLAALAGCSSGPPAQSIEISDDNAFQPQLRASVRLSPRREPASDPQTGHAVELGGTRASGGSDQSLTAGGAYVSIGNRTFNTPAQLSNEFKLQQFEIAYRFRAISPDSDLGIDLLAGPAWYDLDVAVQSGAVRASENLTSVGPQLGLGVLWRPGRGTSLHARGFYFYSADDAAVTRATRVELFLAQALARNVALRGGYSWWSVDSDRGGSTSPIKVEFRGPTLGLELMF